jgi:hypothetical protein
MEVGSQLNTLEKEASVPFRDEARWAPEAIWILGRETTPAPARN